MKYSKVELLKEAIKHKGFIAKIPVVFRMLKAWTKGNYPVKGMDMLLPVIGLIYVISPIDLLPEILIPFVGTLDDLAVLTFVIPKLMKEVDKFLLWEGLQKEGITTIDVEEIK